jgi:hypothetical protein
MRDPTSAKTASERPPESSPRSIQALSEGSISDRGREPAASAVRQHRVHHQAAARAGRRRESAPHNGHSAAAIWSDAETQSMPRSSNFCAAYPAEPLLVLAAIIPRRPGPQKPGWEASTCTASAHFGDVASWQILLKKSFWGDERKFLEPLMRLTRGDVRDHIVLAKIDHGPS